MLSVLQVLITTCFSFCRTLKPSIVIVSFSRVLVHVVGWLVLELRNVHMVDIVEFVDDVRNIQLDELNRGPAIEDMVSFLQSGPELARREYTRHMFRLCCLCLGHVVPNSPKLNSPLVGLPQQIWFHPASWSQYNDICCRVLLKGTFPQIGSLFPYVWSSWRVFVTMR